MFSSSWAHIVPKGFVVFRGYVIVLRMKYI